MSDDIPQNELRGSRNRWMDPLKRTYSRFLKIRGTPKEIARGFALGLFVGMSPFMGLHMAIAVPLASLFKWNKFSAALAVWISNPISAPIIYGITYYTGAKVLLIQDGYKLPSEFNLEALLYTLRSAPEIIVILLVGGIVIGLPLAAVGYYFAYKTITEYRKSLRLKLEVKKYTIAQKLKSNASRKKKKKKKKKRR